MANGSTLSTIDVALKIAGAASSALVPPWNVIGKGAAQAAADILSFFFGGSTAPVPVTLSEIVNALSVQSTLTEIKNASDAITNIANDFVLDTSGSAIPLPANINQALTRDPDGRFATLYNYLYDAVTGSNSNTLLLSITSMSNAVAPGGDIVTPDTNTQAAYLPTFAFGVSTYLLLATYWTSLAVIVDGPDATKDLSLNLAVNYLTGGTINGPQPGGWIGYATSVCNAFDQLVQDRLAQVCPATPVSFTAGLFETDYGIYFTDTGQPVTGFDPTTIDAYPPWPGSEDLEGSGHMADRWPSAVYALATDNSPQQNAPVIALQAAYVAQMRQTIYNNYFDVPTMRQTIAAWSAGAKRLAQYV